MSRRTKAVIKDEAPDYHWWTRLPNIVLSKVDDPYELALLFTIRKVAGDDPEDGICYMSLRTLAGISKMGFNTVRRKIRTLADKGLILAELRKGPKGRTTWHITIPRSLWEDNEKVYQELSQKEQGSSQKEPTVPETIGGCTREDRATVPESTVRLRTIPTKNPSTKKVSVHEKDEHGKYVNRSQKRCSECGQFQRQCYCKENA